MAKFRQIHTTFWQDPKVLEEMTPEDKYFYLYLLTNPCTTQIGVYQITKKQMSFDLGYSIESVNSLFERFINHHKVIKYNDQTRELAILNWGKYNLNKAGKPVLDCVEKELKEVKDKTLLGEIMNHIPNQDVSRAFSRVVHDAYNDTPTISGQEEEKNENKKNICASDADFEKFWTIYPRRVDKKRALKSFNACIKRHPIETILAGTEKYAKQVQHTEAKFIKHPSTFLNNDSFIDGFEEVEQPTTPKKPVVEEKSVLADMWGDD